MRDHNYLYPEGSIWGYCLQCGVLVDHDNMTGMETRQWPWEEDAFNDCDHVRLSMHLFSDARDRVALYKQGKRVEVPQYISIYKEGK